MDVWEGHYDADEGDDDENMPFDYGRSQRDALIFLVEANRHLFTKEINGETHYHLLMRAAKTVQQSKIVSSDKDMTALVFFRTKKCSVPEIKNVFVVQDLAQPDAARILKLEEMAEMKESEFEKTYGFSETCSLYDALWGCQNLFTLSKQRPGIKRILLFTNEDDPHGGNIHAQRQAITKARDLRENDVDLQLIHLPKPDGTPFRLETFYKDLLFEGDDVPSLLDPAEAFEELCYRIRAKDNKKRAIYVSWNLIGDVSLGVGAYNLVRRCCKPTPIRLDKESNEELHSRTRRFLGSTGEVLLPQDLKKSMEFMGRKSYFEMEEVKMIRSITPPGLKLLGFKPLKCLKPHHHVRPVVFLYPAENYMRGSTTLFVALLQRCLEREQFALCWFTPRQGQPPKLVALAPQREETDDKGIQTAPAGFSVVFLPYADDFRKIKLPQTVKATDSQIASAKKLVKALELDYNPQDYENPVLQYHFAFLEALALERNEPDEVVDKTLPDLEAMQRRAAKEVANFKAETECPDPGSGRKRKAGAPSVREKSAKRTADDGENIDLMSYYKKGQLATLTVPLLKAGIKSLGIKTGASKKADLILAIEDYCSM